MWRDRLDQLKATERRSLQRDRDWEYTLRRAL